MRRLKLILLFRSVPSDDIKHRELLEEFGLIERFTPYVAGGRGAWHYSVQIADGDCLAASCAKWGFCWNDAHRSWAVLRGNFTGRSFLVVTSSRVMRTKRLAPTSPFFDTSCSNRCASQDAGALKQASTQIHVS